MKQRLTIVLLENDTDKIRPINGALEKHQYWKLLIAESEDEAVALAVTPDVDVIVLDGLFGGCVLDLLFRIRSSPRTAHIPVLCITGNMGPQTNELMAGGAQQCVAHPIGSRALTIVLREMAGKPVRITQAPRRALNDLARISALEDCCMMDFAPSEEFNEIPKLAARILRVPVALVSLADADRQYFLSQQGLVEPLGSLCSTPLSHSFCQWVIAGKEALVVDDAREHALLSNNLVIRNMGVVAYAGQPITAGGNQVIGSMCAIDGHPRSWTLDELATLQDFAQLTESYIVCEKNLSDAPASNQNVSTLSDAERLSIIQNIAKGVRAITRVLLRKGVPLSLSDRKQLIAMTQSLNSKQLSLV